MLVLSTVKCKRESLCPVLLFSLRVSVRQTVFASYFELGYFGIFSETTGKLAQKCVRGTQKGKPSSSASFILQVRFFTSKTPTENRRDFCQSAQKPSLTVNLLFFPFLSSLSSF